MDRLIIIADDLTGAADTAACFAQAGLRTVVGLVEIGFFLENLVSSTQSNPESGFCPFRKPISSALAAFDVISLSTDSRQCEPIEAARRVRQAVNWLLQADLITQETFFYKKVDSMMRGHPAVELAAMMDALGCDRALVAPAFPAQGRLTLSGKQVIGTDSAGSQIDLAGVFGQSSSAEPPGIHWLPLEQVRQNCPPSQPGLTIADAANESDLEALARGLTAQGFRLACGSAGFARAIQKTCFLPRERIHLASRLLSRPTLVVAGSRALTLARQIEAARQSGVRVISPDAIFLKEEFYQPEETTASLAEILRNGQPAILTTAGLPLSTLGEECIARRLAEVTGRLVEAGLVGKLVLTGGDTAAAVCQRLGASLIELFGEPQPGIAAGALLDGDHAGLPVITKAGAFDCDLGLLIADC